MCTVWVHSPYLPVHLTALHRPLTIEQYDGCGSKTGRTGASGATFRYHFPDDLRSMRTCAGDRCVAVQHGMPYHGLPWGQGHPSGRRWRNRTCVDAVVRAPSIGKVFPSFVAGRWWAAAVPFLPLWGATPGVSCVDFDGLSRCCGVLSLGLLGDLNT